MMRGERRDRGQSTVEFALILPLVALLLALVAQVAVLVYSQLAVVHSAREISHALMVDPDVDVSGLRDQLSWPAARGVTVEVTTTSTVLAGQGERRVIAVTVVHEPPVVLGLFGPFISGHESRFTAKTLSQ